MILFVKNDCSKCDWLKQHGTMPVEMVDVGTSEGLSLLAYHSLVPTAEKELPILLFSNGLIETNMHAIAYCLNSDIEWSGDCEEGNCAL